FVQSATGFGFALILSPALLAALDPYEAVTALLALGVALNLLVLFDGGRPGPVRWRELAPVLAAAIPGLGLGAAALALLAKPVLQVIVGLVVVAAAIVQLRGRVVGTPARRRSAAAAGLASGAMTTSISVSGPPLVLWLESRGVAPAELRATLAVCFLALNLAGCAVLVPLAGADRIASPAVLLSLLVLVVAGHLAGSRAFRRLDAERFSTMVLVLVILTGAASVVAGVLGLT
ncbi:MAG: sulfite exporter TauE/SafE family protein, partial [Thermoleophilaceae bacterium]